ncbi:MAG: glycoside-pentoside-hexuronide (GPH):cation symporter [Klebsiella grimontii]|nr:glycoside-pentoside-hexuronide (GPH):cation symporter [Klebsiella grimontii]
MKDHILSVKEKIGYGMGDAASHIIFDNVMLYMMFFYTDIFGIPAGYVGTMFLLARALDAISDPCMGLLADRTRSRWGKFRYCALGGVITDNPTQRISLQSWRFVLATAGGMLSTVLMMPLVNFIGGEDKAFGFQGGIAVLSVIAFLMLAFCFFTTKERVEAPPSSTSMREDLRDIWRNDQWRVVGLLTILNILAVCVRGGAMMYYTSWIMGSAGLFTAFLTTYCVGNLIGSALAKPLTDWKCKVSVFWWTNAILAVLSVAMFFVPMDAEITMFAFIFVIGVLHQLVTPIQWVMMSDTVDYGEWCNGKRLTGISFAGTLFVLKLGLALGGALIGWMLAGGGYDAAAKTQNSATITIIISLFTLAPAVCYLLSAVIAKRYYTLKTPFLKKMMAELAQGARRNEQEFIAAPNGKELQN